MTIDSMPIKNKDEWGQREKESFYFIQISKIFFNCKRIYYKQACLEVL